MSTSKSSPNPRPPVPRVLTSTDRTFLLTLLRRDNADIDIRCRHYRRRLCLRQQTFMLAVFLLLVTGGHKVLAAIPQPAPERIVTTCTQGCPSEEQLFHQIHTLLHPSSTPSVFS